MIIRKLIVFICILTALSCKKKGDSFNNGDIIGVDWMLTSAIVDRPIPYNGGMSTDFIAINGSQSCIASNFRLTFFADGTYRYSSTGALCDMVPNSKNQTWSRINDTTIVLDKDSNREIRITVNQNTLTYTLANTPGVVYWAVTYTFKAK